jgi:hypothetical protein
LASGRTAIESIATSVFWTGRKTYSAAAATSTASRVAAVASLCRLTPVTMRTTLDAAGAAHRHTFVAGIR